MIEKRPSEITAYNDFVLSDIDEAISALTQVKTTIATFTAFGNADSNTALVVLGMLASVQKGFDDAVKSAAVSLRYVTDDDATAREIAAAVKVSPNTFLKWDEKSVIPSWLTDDTEV